MRGAPGCGKSTWIEKNNLSAYALSADNIRLLFQSPEPGFEKDSLQISQKNDTDVWALLFELLEKRMERGEFVVVDATHSRRSDFSRYNSLCAKYRYRRYFVDFSDVPIEVCKAQNKMRSPEKQVPDRVIDKIYSRLRTQEKTSGWVEIDKDNPWDSLDVKCLDFNKYEKIHVFGDTHGCNTVLQEYFKENPYNADDFYIFCGDYLDRGIENKEVLGFFIDFSKKDNAYCLAGNHERALDDYANDEDIRSKEFKDHTLPQLIDIDKKEIREFYRRLGQLAYFTYNNKKYFITHAGISYLPKHLSLLATENMLRGVGDYSTDIDELWDKNEPDVIQIHGHRNALGIDNTARSFNLEGGVEFGGNLKVLQLSKTGEELIKIKNTVFRTSDEDIPALPTEHISILTQLRNSSDINEKDLGDNIHSFNFTRNVFYEKRWNSLTTHARGLFVDVEKEKVVARSYEKFFNTNERRETDPLSLVKKFRGKKIRSYKKENGYLAILSMVNGELFFASKSTNTGDFAEWFKEIWNTLPVDEDYVKKFLTENDVSLIFEVIDPVRDPHIIKYDKPDCILLDIIKNDWDFYKYTYEDMCDFAIKARLNHKELYKEFKDEREFFKWYLEKTDEDNLSDTDIEGVVIEAETDTPNNPYMVKVKFPYYRLIKMHRGLVDKIRRGSNINFASLYHPISNYFYSWCLEQPKDFLEKDIISLTEMFFVAHPELKP